MNTSRMLLNSLLIGLVLFLCYFGLLALITRGIRKLEPKQAILVLTASVPMRLGLLALGMAWLVHLYGLVGALGMLLGLWPARFIVHRLVKMQQIGE